MKTLAKFIGGTLTLMILLMIGDYIWFKFLAGDIYQKDLKDLLMYENGQMQIRPGATLAVYLSMSLLITHFVIYPALEKNSLFYATYRSAILGGLVYAVYEFTNRAVLEGWSSSVILPDILWGATLFALSGTMGYTILSKFHLR
jgi:uncharacterized membrane protein